MVAGPRFPGCAGGSGPGSLILGTGDGMGQAVPVVSDLLGCPLTFRNGLTGYSGAPAAAAAVQAGRNVREFCVTVEGD